MLLRIAISSYNQICPWILGQLGKSDFLGIKVLGPIYNKDGFDMTIIHALSAIYKD